MKDFLGKELAIGDTVVLTAPSYRHFVKAEIVAFTPKQVRVKYVNTWNYADGYEQTYLGLPNFLVKV